MDSRDLHPKAAAPLVMINSPRKGEPGKPIRKTLEDWVFATLTGPCGDTMELGLRIQDSLVVDSRHWGDGCGHSRSCLQFVAESAKGRAVDDLPELSPDYIVDQVSDLPMESRHCAQLAYDTLMQTVDEYFNPVKQESKEAP